MNIKLLIEYLEILIDVEKNAYIQQRTIDMLHAEIEELKTTETYVAPKEPTEEKNGKSEYIAAATLLVIGVLFAKWGFNLLDSSGILGLLGGLIVVLFSVLFLITSVVMVVIGVKERNAMQAALVKYNDELTLYKNNIEREKPRAQENLRKITVFERELIIVKQSNEKTKSTLLKLYAENIIFSKYRSLPFLCTIYEYLVSGRAKTLDGADGAYNLLEAEMRMNLIITKLNTVISMLNKIQDNQYMLYTTMTEINSKVDILISDTRRLVDMACSIQQLERINLTQMEELKNNSSMSVYYAERIEKELEYMNRMDYLCGRNEDTLFNTPPS